MENLAEPIIVIHAMRRQIEQGIPVKEGLLRFCRSHHLNICKDLFTLLTLIDQSRDLSEFYSRQKTQYRRSLLDLFARGIHGESIYQQVLTLEAELTEICYDDINRHVAQLPVKMLIPLLFLIFPAYFVLLLGPIVQNFFHSF
jgi:hypothetical protein